MRINPPSLHFLLSPSLPHFPHRFLHRASLCPPPPPRGPPHLFSVRSSFSECRLVEFRVQTPSSDESPGAAEGPLARSLPPPPPPLPVPHLPLCNNMLKPTSVFNSMFIWTALGKWKLSLKTGVLKQQHEYKQLFDQQRNMYVCIKRAFYIQARGVSLKICLLLVQDEAIYIIKDLNSFILGSHGHRLPNFQPGNVAWIPQLESVNLSGYSQASLLVCSLLSDQNCRFFFFPH